MKAEPFVSKDNVEAPGADFGARLQTCWTQSQLLQAGDHPDCCQYRTRRPFFSRPLRLNPSQSATVCVLLARALPMQLAG
jgi:hypothetical protein